MAKGLNKLFDNDVLSFLTPASNVYAQEEFPFRWRLFYNNRRLHGRLGNITPAYKWDHYQQQINKEQMMINSTIALSTNGERNTLQIEESRLVDKVIEEQKLNIFEINHH